MFKIFKSISGIHYLLLLSSIPLYEYTTISILIHFVMEHFSVSGSKLVWVQLLQIVMYKSLCGQIIIFKY